jgi:hypothetical protein
MQFEKCAVEAPQLEKNNPYESASRDSIRKSPLSRNLKSTPDADEFHYAWGGDDRFRRGSQLCNIAVDLASLFQLLEITGAFEDPQTQGRMAGLEIVKDCLDCALS